MSGYCQLSLEERCAIARLHDDGQSIRQIAAALDREPSTISRELKRNKGARVGYKPAYTQAQAVARRWSGSRLERDDVLREAVLDRLAAGWSPEQVAGRLARQAGQSVISHESIYRFIYAQARRTNDGSWHQYLPRAKAKRGRRPKPGGSSVSFIRLRRPLAERPPDGLLTPMPASLRQCVTFDNPVLSLSKGAPSSHSITDSSDRLDVFFCDVRVPWQKGGVGNAISRLRRYLPRKADLISFSPEDLAALARAYNNTPRKCLDFKTPAAAISIPLHFKCESRSQLPLGAT